MENRILTNKVIIAFQRHLIEEEKSAATVLIAGIIRVE